MNILNKIYFHSKTDKNQIYGMNIFHFVDISIFLIALSYIHVSAAYRSRIYENFDTPNTEPYFVRATYVPRTCEFLLRSRGESVTYLYSYGISISYVRRIKAYVLRTCGVCVAYEVYT